VWCNPSSFREEARYVRYFITQENAELYADIANEDDGYCDYIYSVGIVKVDD